MSIILLLAAQAAGQEVTTFYPLPSKEQQAEELRKVQGLPPIAPAPAAAPETAKSTQPAPPQKPAEVEEMKVLSVREVPPTANVIFVPPPEEPR